MRHEDLSEELLTMLAKCEAARCLDSGEPVTRVVSQLAYPNIPNRKRFPLLIEPCLSGCHPTEE